MKLVFGVLLLVAAAAAGPLQTSPSRECRRRCAHSEVAKLSYIPGMTYEYELHSEFSVRMTNVSQEAELEWSATVALHVESPCEVVIEIKEPIVQGKPSGSLEEQLTRYPLRAVILDGVFEEICVDQDDPKVAVNIKKGILSMLQNSLPSNSSLNDGIKASEMDVIGICPTVYNVKHEGDKVVVKKSKDHRLCSQRYGDGSESPLSAIPLKSVIPMRSSQSECVQEIQGGLFKTVTCRDDNEIAPILGVEKSVAAQQNSKLTLKTTMRTDAVRQIKNARKTSLLYDFTSEPKNASAVSEMELKLKGLCAVIEKGSVTMQTAQMFSDLISAMDDVEEPVIYEVWKNIKSKKYCSQSDDLEAIYLDAIPATENHGAVKVMAENILNKQRLFQYTWRLQTLKRVCSNGVAAVQPLLEDDDLPSFVTLAVGTVVKTYCSTEGRQYDGTCRMDEKLQRLMQTVSQRLTTSCTQASNDRKHEKTALILLKTVGNMKNISDVLRPTVKECFSDSKVPLRVRLQAAEVLKNTKLSREDIEEMLGIATDKSEKTELRIFAYKTAVLSASKTELGHLITKITSQEYNDQARAYILSDLTNLQLTEAPYKIDVKERLASFNISQNYPSNLVNSSHSFDFSKFTRSGSFGFEYLQDAIFDQQEKTLRQWRSNLTFDIFDEIVNVGEWGFRLENVPALLESILNSENGIGNTALGRMLKMYIPKQGESSRGKLDFFLKILGQERLFVSLASDEDYASDILARLYMIIGEIYNEIITQKQIHSFQAFQSRCNLEISTVQGIPILFSRDLSVVGSTNSKASLIELGSSFQYAPVVSIVTNYFIGYKFGPTLGLKLNTTIHSSSDVIVSAKVNLPSSLSFKLNFPQDNAEAFRFENRGYLMTKLPYERERALPPSTLNDPRIKAENVCYSSVAGLKMCSDYNVADLWAKTDYPLVAPSYIRTTIKKENPSIEGFEVSLTEKSESDGYSMKIEIPGSENPTKMAAEIGFSEQQDRKVLKLKSRVEENVHSLEMVITSKNQGIKLRQLEIYFGVGSSPPEKVLTGKCSRSDEGKLEVALKTLGALRSVILTDVQVDITNEEHNSIRINKLEALLGTGDYKAHGQITENRQGPQQRVFSGVFEALYNTVKLLSVHSTAKSEMHTDGYAFNTMTRIEHGSQAKSINATLVNKLSKRLLAVEINEGSTQPVVLLVSDEMQHQIRKSLVLVTVPHKKINVRMTSRKSPQEIDLSVASQGEEVASIKGPFTWVRSQDSLHQKSHLGIRISGPESRSYHVDTEIDISSNKNKVLFTINKAQQLLISYQHDVSGNYESGLSAMSKIEIPEKIKTDFKLEKSSSHVQSDGEVKLEVYSPHHLQYQVSVDRSGSPHQPEGKFSAKIYLDKIRDPEHNVQLSGTYMLEDNSHFSLRGDARIARESYHYALTSSLEGQQSWRNIDKHIKLQIMKESEEFLTLLSSQKFHLVPQHSLELDSELSLITPSKKEYYLKKQLEVNHEDSATQIKNSFTSHVTDIGEFKSTFSLNSHYQPDLALQLEGELSSSGLNEAQPALQINYKTDLEMSPSSLRRLDAAMNCDISGEKLNVQVSESESDREASLKVLKNDRMILFAHILREEQDGLSAKFDIPPHSFAVSGRYNNQEKSLVIYPNSGEQHGKFTAKFTNQFSEPEQQMNVLLEYPHAGRQKMVLGKFSSGDASTNGHVSFDIFPHSEEAINIKVNATKLGDDMMRYEASVLSSSDVADGPRVVMDVTAADHEKALLVAYRSNLESAPSSLLAAKYIKQSQQSGIVSVLLKTQNKKFEIGGVLKKEHTIGCQGYNLNTTVLSPSDKTYALQIETCSPAFIKVITGAKDAPEEKYVIKAGVKSMTHAELSLTKNMRVPASEWVKKWSGSEFEQKEVPVAAVAAKLVGSQTLALKAQYDQDILAPTKSLMARELSSATRAASEFIKDITGKIADDVTRQFPKAQKALESLRGGLENIQDSRFVLEIKESFSNLPHFKELFVKMLEGFKNAVDEIEKAWDDAIDKMEDMFSVFEHIKDMIDNAISWLTPENVSQLFDQYWEKLQLPSILRDVDNWTSGWPQSQAAAQMLPINLPGLVRQTTSDLREYGELLLHDDSVKFAHNFAKRSLQKLRNHDLTHMLQYWLLAPCHWNMGLYVGNSTVQLNLPLRRSVGSLTAAVYNIGRKSNSSLA